MTKSKVYLRANFWEKIQIFSAKMRLLGEFQPSYFGCFIFYESKGRNFASFRSLTIMVIFSAAGLLCYVTIHSLRKRSINRRSRYVLMEKNWNELNYNWSSARLIQNSLMLLKLPTAFIQYFVRQFIVEISQQRDSFLFFF